MEASHACHKCTLRLLCRLYKLQPVLLLVVWIMTNGLLSQVKAMIKWVIERLCCNQCFFVLNIPLITSQFNIIAQPPPLSLQGQIWLSKWSLQIFRLKACHALIVIYHSSLLLDRSTIEDMWKASIYFYRCWIIKEGTFI